jgi:hypothetical protein
MHPCRRLYPIKVASHVDMPVIQNARRNARRNVYSRPRWSPPTNNIKNLDSLHVDKALDIFHVKTVSEDQVSRSSIKYQHLSC